MCEFRFRHLLSGRTLASPRPPSMPEAPTSDASPLAAAVAAHPPGDLRTALAGFHSARAAVGETKRAVAAYRRALTLRPDFSDALFNMGNALAKANEYEAAIDLYRRALSLPVPNTAGARIRTNLAEALRALGRHDEGI